jgi:hypothetical protein
MNAEKPTQAKCKFPEESWTGNYKTKSSPLNSMIPSTWREKLILIDLPTGEAEKQECLDLMKFQELLTQADKDLIVAQAPTPNSAVAPLWDVVGFDPSKLFIMELIDLQAKVLDCMRAPIFLLKTDVNRGRPGHCCKDSLAPKVLEPMFPAGEIDHPGHPSYPSGHACYAYAMALVLGAIKPEHMQALKDAAIKVAHNRELAGLHFASDSVAGRELATHLVKLLMRNPAFKIVFKDASDKWP